MTKHQEKVFWLNKYTCEFHFGKLSDDDIKVIQYSAFEDLQNELKQVREIGVEMQREVNRTLSKENDILKKELQNKDAVRLWNENEKLKQIIKIQSTALTLVHPDNFKYDETNDHIAREILVAKEDVENLMKDLEG